MKNILFFLLVTVSVNAQDFSKYLPKPIVSTGSFQHNNASYYPYSRYTENYEDSVITQTFAGKTIESYTSQVNKAILEANKDFTVNRIMLHSFVSISNYTARWEAVKYRKILAKDTTVYQVLVLKFENQKIQEDNESEASQILRDLLRLKSEVFSQFEYEKPTNKYKDLSQIIESCKDVDGTLNLGKLGA